MALPNWNVRDEIAKIVGQSKDMGNAMLCDDGVVRPASDVFYVKIEFDGGGTRIFTTGANGKYK